MADSRQSTAVSLRSDKTGAEGHNEGLPDPKPVPASLTRIESLLEEQAARRSSHVAVVDGKRRTTYQELHRRAVVFAARLRDEGVAPGDRVSIYLDKSLEYVVALYGVWTAGAVSVPINDVLLPAQVIHILHDSGSRVLVSSAMRLGRTRMPPVHGVRFLDVEGPSADMRRDALPGGVEPAAILYTSGSTGKPKGIVVSHSNLVAGAEIVTGYLGLSADDRIISVLPFGFDYGLNQLLGAVQRGATLVLQRSHLPADICRTLLDEEITAMAAVPPLWIQLAQRHSPFLKTEFPRLRLITNSGGALPVELVRRFREALPKLRIFLMYGLSEAFRSTYLPPEQIDQRPRSIGKPIPQTEVFVLSEKGDICPPGTVGELVHRGPTVALGYWNNPEATAATFRPCPPLTGNASDQVVFSGDLVYRDEEGFLYFAGRRDQLIKSLGYRVSAEEIEELLLACDGIKEAAVTSEPDAERGAAIIAYVVPNGTAVTEDQLFAYARKTMPNYMQPKRFVLRPALPRTGSGKIDRKGL